MYQGPDGWTAPRRLSELFDLPPKLAASLTFPVDLVFDIDDLREAVLSDVIVRDAPIVVYVEAARVLLLVSRVRVPFEPTLEDRIAALGSLRNVTSVLPPGSPVLDRIFGLISPDKRTMYLDVYDDMKAEGGLVRQRKDLFKVPAHRNLALDEPLRARVLACTNEQQFERWFDRALTATTVAEIFDDP